MGSPSIILTSQFKFSDVGKIFGGFLGYMGREEAIAEERLVTLKSISVRLQLMNISKKKLANYCMMKKKILMDS